MEACSAEATPPALKRPKVNRSGSGSQPVASPPASGTESVDLSDQPEKQHLLTCFDVLESGLYFGHRVRGREFVSFDALNDDPASQLCFTKNHLAQILALMPDAYVVTSTDVQKSNGEWTEKVS